MTTPEEPSESLDMLEISSVLKEVAGMVERGDPVEVAISKLEHLREMRRWQVEG